MGPYILRRLIVFVPMLVAISMLTFAFINLAPGDPIYAMVDREKLAELSEQDLQRLREKLGLHKPMVVRYGIWLGQMVRGNFGYSYHTHWPVLKMISGRLLPTLELTVAALVLSTVFGVLFGVIAAVKQYSFYDYSLSVLSLLGLSVPTFFFALLAMFIFAATFELLPVQHMSSFEGDFSIWDNLWHLIMPATVLSIDMMAGNTRYARTAMLEVMKSDYVTTARAKGLSEYAVMGRHAFRNALLPMITVTTLRLPFLLGGAIVVETMFTWPGIGLLSIDSIFRRDYPTLMGLGLIIALLVLASNLLADILYAYADPRIRVGRKAT